MTVCQCVPMPEACNVASSAVPMADHTRRAPTTCPRLDLRDLHWVSRPYRPYSVYATSKLLLVMAAAALQRRADCRWVGGGGGLLVAQACQAIRSACASACAVHVRVRQ